MKERLNGQVVVLGYSGGPDATALAHRLRKIGANVLPVYINYRKVCAGGKTGKDLEAARASATMLDMMHPLEVRAPLGKRPKSNRNRFFVSILARIARERGSKLVALGTIKDNGDDRGLGRATRNDLDPLILAQHGARAGVRVITWDTFHVRDKTGEFADIPLTGQRALFVTTSCQLWFRLECGNCTSCRSRHRAFMQAFGFDPTLYRPESRIGRETNLHRQ